MEIAAVVLAAGLGKRMNSAKVKVAHHLCGKPIISYIIETISKLEPSLTVVVVGHQADEVKKIIPKKVVTVNQKNPLGTGDAVRLTESALAGFTGPILVIPGDTPLLQASTLKNLINIFENEKPAALILTADLEDPFGYGRLKMSADGLSVLGIVEERDATKAEKEIKTINAGVYCFEKNKLFAALKKIQAKNNQGEYYLTDVISVLNNDNEKVMSVSTGADEIAGINSRVQLAEAEAALQSSIKRQHMLNGVTFILSNSSFIGKDVTIGRDTIIYPHSYITGATRIGADSHIGPSVKINKSKIGSRVRAQYAVIMESEIDDNANIGPFCSLRPGTVIKKNGKAGTFVELKKTVLGENSKIPHLSYFGDADIGKDVNVGAGSITCNYDGYNKWRTIIEDGAFLGSDTMLIAPVKLGKGAVTAAGSAITKDIPSEHLGIERGEQKNISGWVSKHKKKSKNRNKK